MKNSIAALPVESEGLTRRFGDLTAVDRVSLQVGEGTILGVIGPSGSGKTTLIRMLTGILRPTAGFVRVLGEEPGHFRRRTRERIGYMPQRFELYEDLTASENLSFVASLFGMLWPGRTRRVREMLRVVGLWDARNRRARNLSGGMQRRLALAAALVHRPRLMFVDEPTAGIDPILRQEIWQEFRRLRDEGRSLLVTTQYVGEAEYCDRVALLAQGKLIALDEPETLRREALGGDVIELVADRAVDGAFLTDLEGVREVRQKGPRELLVIAEDAGMVTPRLVEAMQGRGVGVIRSSEYHPSFDEVFSELVSRSKSQPSTVQELEKVAA